MNDTITIDLKGLEQVIKSLKGKLPIVSIGVVKESRAKGKQSNAAIGIYHEYGTAKLPRRSFLRVPLIDNLEKYLEKSGAFDRDALARVVQQGSLFPWMQKVSVLCEQIVQDAFDTGGFGKWPKWKPGYQNNSGQLLVDTTQLRNSIASEVR